MLLDISTPKLFTIIIEGTLTFKNTNLELHAHFILANKGNIIIGTPKNPITSNITITLYGKKSDKQLPIFGNKMLAVHKGILEIHGIKREPTFTLLSETAALGTDTIKLKQAVDWKAGEVIVIASTDYDHLHSERRTIKSVIDSKTLVLDSPLDYKHYSAIETYGGEKFPMECEVGLLTRNIVIKGDNTSQETRYGGHLMVHGEEQEGTMARISYAEFKDMGQSTIVGRYPIHFHQNGDMMKSYVEGNSVHDSNARMITLHGVRYILEFYKLIYFFIF